MCQRAIFWSHWFSLFFSIFFFYWHMLCSLNIIDALCFCLSEVLNLKLNNCLALFCSLLIFEPIAHTCTPQIFPIFPTSDMKLKYDYDSMAKRASEQMRSPASKPFRPTLVTMSSNLIWPSDNQQDLKLQQGLWQEGDQVIHPFASNCRSSSLKAEGTKMSTSGSGYCSASFTKTNINYRAIVWGPPNNVSHFLRLPRWWEDWVIQTQLSLSRLFVISE